MTVKQLIKALEKVVAEHGNVPVCVDWPEFQAWANGVGEIIDVHEVVYDEIPLVDGDGFRELTKSGVERTKRCVVLK